MNNSGNTTRLVITILVSLYFIYYLLTPTGWHFIDSINLIIHEAGHVIFMFFGTFLHVLGGSLFQIAFPFVFVMYFFRKLEYFSASLTMFWVGQNIINVSVYAKDALAMELPLLGGDSAGHDWHNLLDMTGLLHHTDMIGTSIYILGILTLVSASYFSFITFQKTSPRAEQ